MVVRCNLQSYRVDLNCPTIDDCLGSPGSNLQQTTAGGTVIERIPFHDAMLRYINGNDRVAESICERLADPIRIAVRRILTDTDRDLEDILQDSLVAFLAYLRKAGSPPDNPEAFAATIARNRCYNLVLWRRRRQAADVDDLADRLPSATVSPLDLIEERERQDLLADTLARLDERCRRLLRAIYTEGTTIESLRDTLGLKSVQAVYYRRDACLKQATKFLNRTLFSCRLIERPNTETGDGE